MLPTIQMLDELQIILKRKIARLAIEPGAAPALAHRRTRRHQHRPADKARDVEPRRPRLGLARIRGRARAPHVLLARQRRFVPRFAFLALPEVVLRRARGVLLAVPGLAEGGIAAGAVAVGALLVGTHGYWVAEDEGGGLLGPGVGRRVEIKKTKAAGVVAAISERHAFCASGVFGLGRAGVEP